jgi:hypothetical protein
LQNIFDIVNSFYCMIFQSMAFRGRRPRKIAQQFCGFAAGRAQGIAAESPQDLHRQIRGLGAESPVFLDTRSASKKMRPKTGAFR